MGERKVKKRDRPLHIAAADTVMTKDLYITVGALYNSPVFSTIFYGRVPSGFGTAPLSLPTDSVEVSAGEMPVGMIAAHGAAIVRCTLHVDCQAVDTISLQPMPPVGLERPR
jgi:hypothetical protein